MLDFERFPRVDLCHRPTPLEPMARLSAQLGGPNLFVKRDDCTGLAGGGNKTRKLEFLIGGALAENAGMVVTQGAVQSNHVRQTAAAACRFGLGCRALLERRVKRAGEKYAASGNVFLDRMFGAVLEHRDPGPDMNEEARKVCARLRGEGRRPYFIPGGGSDETGALGYALCAQELTEQSRAAGLKIDWIVTATGSAGTQAGLTAGLFGLKADIPVMGISVRHPQDKQSAAVRSLAARTADKLGLGDFPGDNILVDDGYVGEGYGVPADSTIEAVMTAARTEGLLLDPVYSGKGFAGMTGLIRRGFFKPGQNVVFLHTGGAQALAAYEDAFQADLERSRAA